jgi:hypothetical protein
VQDFVIAAATKRRFAAKAFDQAVLAIMPIAEALTKRQKK